LLDTGVGVGAGAAGDVGLGLGLAEDELAGVVVGETLGVMVGEPLGVDVGEALGVGVAAGQVWDRLNHETCFAPSCVSTVAEALSRTAPGAELANACLSLGGPNVVIVWVPPGLNVTVRETKTVELPGRTKAHPSSVLGMLPHWASWPLKPAAVIGVA
jgi:hypothetical protein